jgi:hypothetical protein
MEALFTETELSFEKVAVVGKVGDSEELWPQELLDLFYEQHPYLADGESIPVMTNVNAERGYAAGVIVVKKKPKTVPRDVDAADVTKEIRFPFVIKAKTVSPFDVFIVGESFHPATPGNVERAVFKPEMFDIARTLPGDVSLVNQLYPPYRSRYGFGTSFEGGQGGKFASVRMLDQLTPFLSKADLQRVADTLSNDIELTKKATAHEPLRKALQKLAAVETLSSEDIREARRLSVNPDVIQFTMAGSNAVRVKSANSQMFSPQETTMTFKEAASLLPPELKTQLLASGNVTVGADPVVRDSFEENKAVLIKNAGLYSIRRGSSDGGIMHGADALAFTSVVDFDMTSLPVTLAVFFNGDWAFQDQIAGIPSAELHRDVPDFLSKPMRVGDFADMDTYMGSPSSSSDRPSYGMIDKALAMPKLGTVVFVKKNTTTVPVTIKSIRLNGDHVVLSVTTAMEEILELIPTAGIRRIEKLGARKYAIPMDLSVVRLQKLVKTHSKPEQYVKIASSTVELISDGNVFAFRRHPSLSKLGSTDFLNRNEALFLAAAMGIHVPAAEKMMKRAMAGHVVRIAGIRPIMTEREKISSVITQLAPLAEKITSMRILLLKEAAVLPNEDTVDKVLSLNFITPENISLFTGNLPSYVNTCSELAKLLIGVRLGLEEIPEGAVTRAMNSLQGVIEALQSLSYNKPLSA